MVSRSVATPFAAWRRGLVVAGMAVGLMASGAAHSEVWGFVDSRGVAHFASERLDDRYELFFRGNGQADAPPVTEATPRAVTVPTAPAKLLAFFEVSNVFKQVRPHMREAARQYQVDFELIQALIATESGFDPQAVSPRGAVGLMQLMPATAREWGVSPDLKRNVHEKLLDPNTNVNVGTRYLRFLLDRFPDRLDLALAAYNAGIGAVARAGRRVPDIKETQDYVRTVKQLYEMLRPPPAVVQSRQAASRRTGPELQPQVVALRGGARGRANMPASFQPPVEASPSLPLVSAARGEWRVERPGSEEVVR